MRRNTHEYHLDKWTPIPNPFGYEGEQDERTLPGDYDYCMAFAHSDSDLLFDIHMSESDEEYPYLIQIVVADKEDLIFVRDIKNLVELWDKLRLVLGITLPRFN
jgi:hypothetical protein